MKTFTFTEKELATLLKIVQAEGFSRSSEGHNGEYPHYWNKKEIWEDTYFPKKYLKNYIRRMKYRIKKHGATNYCKEL